MNVSFTLKTCLLCLCPDNSVCSNRHFGPRSNFQCCLLPFPFNVPLHLALHINTVVSLLWSAFVLSTLTLSLPPQWPWCFTTPCLWLWSSKTAGHVLLLIFSGLFPRSLSRPDLSTYLIFSVPVIGSLSSFAVAPVSCRWPGWCLELV